MLPGESAVPDRGHPSGSYTATMKVKYIVAACLMSGMVAAVWPEHAGAQNNKSDIADGEENHDGSKALQGMLDAIDDAPAGSVYVMAVEDGLDYAGIGGLMSTAMKSRGLAGAVVDGGLRDTPQVTKLQFPVFSRGTVPSTTVNHFRFAGKDIPIKCAGVTVNPNDIIVADMDGVVVVPRNKAAEVLKKAQELDNTEHSMYPFIEKFRSIREAVSKFGRI
jgi:4-hydroxy-4-methyl-2-oxoglutarate aldolase